MSGRLLLNLASATSRNAASSLRTSSNRLSQPQVIPFQTTQFLPTRYFSDDATNPFPADGEYITGRVRFFFNKEQYGFVVPDGVSMEDKTNHHFIHGNQIIFQKGPENEKMFPALQQGERVRFKVSPISEEGKKGKAYDLTLENGDPIPILLKGYRERFIKKRKAQFGDEVYEIMETSTNQQEMEGKIVAAFEKARTDIHKRSERYEKITNFVNEQESQGKEE